MSLKRVGGALLVVVALSACSTPVDPEAVASESVAPAPVAPAPVAPEPVAPAVMDKAGWISGSRALLDEYTANDMGMLFVGVALCGKMPMTQEKAALYAANAEPGDMAMSADEFLTLAALADKTLCPGGIMLPEEP